MPHKNKHQRVLRNYRCKCLKIRCPNRYPELPFLFFFWGGGGFPSFFSLRGTPCSFEHFSLLLQGIEGFGREKRSLFWGVVFLAFFSKKKQGKKDQGSDLSCDVYSRFQLRDSAAILQSAILLRFEIVAIAILRFGHLRSLHAWHLLVGGNRPDASTWLPPVTALFPCSLVWYFCGCDVCVIVWSLSVLLM